MITRARSQKPPRGTKSQRSASKQGEPSEEEEGQIKPQGDDDSCKPHHNSNLDDDDDDGDKQNPLKRKKSQLSEPIDAIYQVYPGRFFNQIPGGWLLHS